MWLRGGFVLSAVLTVLFTGLTALTLVSPHWLEAGFGLDLDHFGGGAERALAVGAGLCALACAALTRRLLPRGEASHG